MRPASSKKSAPAATRGVAMGGVSGSVTLGRVDGAGQSSTFNRPADGSVVMRLTGVRLITNRPESDGWIWLEGVKLNRDCSWGAHALVMARASLLAPEPR